MGIAELKHFRSLYRREPSNPVFQALAKELHISLEDEEPQPSSPLSHPVLYQPKPKPKPIDEDTLDQILAAYNLVQQAADKLVREGKAKYIDGKYFAATC
jgi:hypothetical protein